MKNVIGRKDVRSSVVVELNEDVDIKVSNVYTEVKSANVYDALDYAKIINGSVSVDGKYMASLTDGEYFITGALTKIFALIVIKNMLKYKISAINVVRDEKFENALNIIGDEEMINTYKEAIQQPMIMTKGRAKINIDLFLEKFNGEDYRTILYMGNNIIVDNDHEKVNIERLFLEDANDDAYMELVYNRILKDTMVENKSLIIEVNGVRDNNMRNNFNIKRLVETVDLALYGDYIIKDRKDIDLLGAKLLNDIQ